MENDKGHLVNIEKIEYHYHNHIDTAEIISLLNILKLQNKKIMDFQQLLNEQFGLLNETTNGIAGDVTRVVNSNANIAGDLQKLLDQIKSGLTPEQATAAVSTLTNAVATLKTGGEGLKAAADALEQTAAVVPEVPAEG